MKYHFQNMVRLGFHFVLVGPGFQDRLWLLLLVLVCRTWLLVSVVGGGPVLQDSLITIGSGFQDMVVGFHFVLVGPGFWDIVVVGPGPTC